MKLDTGFVTPRRDQAPWAAGVLAVILVLLLLSATLLLRTALGLRGEIDRLEARHAELGERLRKQKPDVDLPAAGELAKVREQVASVNAVVAQRGQPTARLFSTLERLLPDRAYLVGLHHLPRDGEATVVAASPDSAALAVFMQRLEAAPEFASVLLARRSETNSAAGAHTQFELKLREAL